MESTLLDYCFFFFSSRRRHTRYWRDWSSDVCSSDLNGLYQRNRLRRRPGTVAVAAAIQNKYNITVVPHILCSGFSREETEYVLLDLQFLNITDLLVLRGDKAKHESSFTPEKDGYYHAIELQEQINRFNQGIFVDGSEMKVTNTPFSYGVACYPEKHEEAPNKIGRASCRERV